MHTGLKSKGKGNDWKASHKITQRCSQEESLIVPEALANSSCKETKFPSPTTFPVSLLTKKRNPSVHKTEELTKVGGVRLNKLSAIAFFTCLHVTRKGRKQNAILRPHWLVEHLLCAGHCAKYLIYII